MSISRQKVDFSLWSVHLVRGDLVGTHSNTRYWLGSGHMPHALSWPTQSLQDGQKDLQTYKIGKRMDGLYSYMYL